MCPFLVIGQYCFGCIFDTTVHMLTSSLAMPMSAHKQTLLPGVLVYVLEVLLVSMGVSGLLQLQICILHH